MEKRNLTGIVVLGIFGFSLALPGCGGGTSGDTPPPPPVKTVTSVVVACAPATLQLVASGSEPTSQCTATVNYSDGTSSSSNSLVSWTLAPSTAGTISATGLFAPSASITSQTQVTVTATSTENAAKSGTATVTVNPPPVAPTIALSASAATVAFGNSAFFTIVKTGTPEPSVTCRVAGTGTCTVGGDAMTYAVANPANAPTSFVDTVTVTAQNSAGSASATLTINLVASITSATVHGGVDPQAAFCARYNCGVGVDIVGTGFFSSSGFLQDLVAPVNGTVNCGTSLTDSSHATMSCLVGRRDFRPKPWHVGVREPGPCCGFDSNVVNFVFLGNLDTMDISSTDAFQLNQSAATNTVKKFRLADGSLDASFNFNLDGDANTIAVDDQTGDFILSQIGNPGSFFAYDASGALVGGGGNGQITFAVAAKGGYMCGSEDVAGQIVSLPVTSNGPPFGALIVGNTPWQTAMLTLNNQLVCTVFDAGDLKFTVAPIPIPSVNPAPLWTLTVAGLTPLNQIPGTIVPGNLMPNGGWLLIASQSAEKAAVLSRFDRKVVIIDLLGRSQQAVDLAPHLGGAVILRMAADNAHRKAVISLAQTATETSTFISLDLTTGAVVPMSATAPFYATDLRVSSPDGATLYVGNSAGTFIRVPNN